jgi:hypothetical protein
MSLVFLSLRSPFSLIILSYWVQQAKDMVSNQVITPRVSDLLH